MPLPATCLAVRAACLRCSSRAATADTSAADTGRSRRGFKPMFNGKDLTGWVNVNCAPGHVLREGRRDHHHRQADRLPAHRQAVRELRRSRWTGCTSNTKEVGNSGLFVWGDPLPAVGTGYTRGIEVQVLVNLTYNDKDGDVTATSHGDLFSIWGATCKPDRPHPTGWERCLPSENRAKGGGEWNHYKVDRQRRRHQAGGQRQGSVRREQVQPAQGLPGPGERRGRVPLQEHQDQGTAEHQPEAGGVREGGRGVTCRCSTAST